MPIDGMYPGQVIEGLLGVASTGNEQVAVSIELTNEEGGPTGERVAWYGSFTENAYPYTVKTLRVMGWKGDDLSDLSTIAGTPVSVVLQSDEYKGKIRQKVAFVNAPGTGALLKEPMTPDAAKSFAARMKAKIRAVDVEAGKPRESGAPPKRAPKSRAGAISPEPPYDNTEDIPF